MKIEKHIDGQTVEYYYDGVKRYSHYRNSNGFEEWHEYDAAGNETHFRDSNGYERWREYDAAGNETYFRDSNGYERHTQSQFVEIAEADVKPFEFGK